jgi:hypothetical protein
MPKVRQGSRPSASSGPSLGNFLRYSTRVIGQRRVRVPAASQRLGQGVPSPSGRRTDAIGDTAAYVYHRCAGTTLKFISNFPLVHGSRTKFIGLSRCIQLLCPLRPGLPGDLALHSAECCQTPDILSEPLSNRHTLWQPSGTGSSDTFVRRHDGITL